MAKDDYEVIVYKILVYLYACLKRKVIFDQTVFNKLIRKDVISDDYLTDILRLMKSEEMITNINFVKAWGNTYILLSELNEIEITAKGIRYLHENGRANKIKELLTGSADAILGLIGLLGL